MKKMRTAVLLVNMFLLVVCAGAQTAMSDCEFNELPTEKVILHTDRDKYLVGEKIWFTAYCLLEGKLEKELSQVVLVELFDQNNRSFIQQKFQVVEGIASGALEIPEEVGTGYFFLRAYTQYLRNFTPSDYANVLLTVINPLSEAMTIQESVKSAIKQEDNTYPRNQQEPEWLKFQVQTNQSTYGQREKISLLVGKTFPGLAHVSISVRAVGTGNSSAGAYEFLNKNPWLIPSFLSQWPLEKETLATLKKQPNPSLSPASASKEIGYLPDIRGISLTGIVRDKNTKAPVPGVLCMASVVGKQAQVHLNTSREDGSFLFAFDGLQGEQDLCVGMSNRDAGEVELLINNDFSTDFSPLTPVPLRFDSAQHQLFERMYLNLQLQKRYSWAQTVSSTKPAEDIIPSTNLGKSDQVFFLKDFVEFPTLEDVFKEVITFIKVKGKPGLRSLSVWDEKKKQYNDNPVVLLDHVPIYDIDELLKLNPSSVTEIAVVYSNYVLGDYLFGGLISLQTNTDNFANYQWPGESVFLPYTTFSTAEGFTYPDYSISGVDQSRKPDFRTTLYWNPAFLVKDSDMSLDFYTSDFAGAYEIEVRGITDEGKLVYGKAEFLVK